MSVVVLPKEYSAKLDQAIKISYVGDLILLRDAVENGYDKNERRYSFEDMFAWMRPYWESDDLTLAVFEGPMAGSAKPYSTSDFDDGIPLKLNFPDAFGDAVKKSGVDYVTLANNHLLDQGYEGAMRTLDRLDEIGLKHGGAFRNEEEKKAIRILDVRGRKIVVLEYTYGSNYYPDNYFFDGKTSHVTRPIVGLGSEFLKENVRQVRADMDRAKALEVDAIVVMSHMGEQFLHTPDKTQQFWCDEFVKGGADVILSDHPHAVQPIEWRTGVGGKDVLIVHCPGNFTNSYAPYDGDASYMAEIYFNPDNGKPMASSFVPLYGYGVPGGNFAGVPIYDAVHNAAFMSRLSRNDFRRLQDVQRVVTRVVLGEKVELVNAAKRYYLFPTGEKFLHPVKSLDLSKVPKESKLLQLINHAKHICFVGDSVTEGTKNHGVGWYEPLMENFLHKRVSSYAKGSMTSKWFCDNRAEIAAKCADLYVVAFGCNDIRYRNPETCAMNAQAYVENCKSLVEAIRGANYNAEVVFIAPWESAANDMICKVSIAEKEILYKDYVQALVMTCRDLNCTFINPNPYIWTKIDKNTIGSGYMVDYIHPGSSRGCALYSEGCLWAR